MAATADRAGFDRRRFLGLLGAGAAGAAVGVGGAVAAGQATAEPDGAASSGTPGSITYPFYGTHQAGIATPAQSAAALAAFDLPRRAQRAQVVDLLRAWTLSAAAMTQGDPAPSDALPHLVAEPAGLTVTVGFGPGFFDILGLTDQRPPGVADYPPFAGDDLRPQYSGGDLLVQVCADDPVVVSHAVNALTADAASTLTPRWRQTGFRRGNGVAEGQTTRNLMGQKDGTANPSPDDPAFDQTLWAAPAAGVPAWYVGGTTLVLRRISMDLPAWYGADQRTQERTLGRHLESGAPLGLDDEFAPVPLTAQAADGSLVIPSSAHVRLAHPDSNSGARMIRRGFSYDSGEDAGLLFIALQADATRGFIPVQSRMAAGDDLNRFTTAVGSAAFAIPPGCAEGGYVGETLLG